MSARPGNWDLLECHGGDPLPGDPQEVATQAAHYRDLAEEIRAQVARLRQLASGTNELVGRFAPELRTNAEDLAEHLGQTQDRFDTVAEQLGRWQPELDHGRTVTGSLLRQAEDAHHQVSSNQPSHTPVDPTDSAAVAADHARGTRLTEATSQLTALVTRCRTLLSEVNRVGDDVARKIDDASHDKLKDSWWDSHVRKFVHDHADFLKLVADVLTYVATALVIAVLLLSNPAGWIVLAAMALTAGAMLIHTALAANGDGSWVDVGLDAFALVTMGGGKLLSEGARAALATREGIGAFAKSTSAARDALADASGLLSKTGVWLTRGNAVSRNLRGAVAGVSRFSEVLTKELPGHASWLSRLAFGEKEGALLHQAISRSLAEYGPGLLLNSARVMSNGARVAFQTGAVVDLTGKALNPAFPNYWNDWKPLKPGVPAWDRWVEEHTVHGAPVFR